MTCRQGIRGACGRAGVISAAVAAGLGAAALLIGCGGEAARPAHQVEAAAPLVAGTGLRPIESAVALTPGAMLVMPVEITGALPTGPVAVRVGEERPLRGALVWIGVRARPEEEVRRVGGPAYASRWMGDVGAWSVTAAGQAVRPESVGTWAVVAEVPEDFPLRGSTTVWIGDRPVPAAVVAEGPHGVGLWPVLSPPEGLRAETVQSMQASPWLARTLAAQSESPAARWRARLAWRLLGRPDLAGESAAAPRFADPVLEGMAAQAERRWAAGVSRVHSVDPETASQLAWRLAAVVEMGGGVAMPAWRGEDAAMRTLGEDLINPLLGPSEAAARARAWLEGLPAAAAWIADDAGAIDAATGGAIAGVGVVNLGLEPAVAWAAFGDGARSGELTTAPPLAVRRVPCVAPVGGEGGREGVKIVTAEVAGRVMRREVVASALPVRPPGLRMGPLVRDLTMGQWLSHTSEGAVAAAEPPAPEWATAALLFREEEPGAQGPEGAPAARWVLYVECRRAEVRALGAAAAGGAAPTPGIGQVQRGRGEAGEGAAGDAAEELRVWLGPTGNPSARLRVFPSGLMLDDIAPGRPAERVAVRVEEDRWSCWIPIPARCIEPGGRVRLALERTDARGERTAWPRAMFPWQREPGRVAVDLTAWGAAAPTKP